MSPVGSLLAFSDVDEWGRESTAEVGVRSLFIACWTHLREVPSCDNVVVYMIQREMRCSPLVLRRSCS